MLPFMNPVAQYSPYAWMLPPELWPKLKRFYIYQLDFLTAAGKQLPASGTAENTRGIDRDSYFACVQMAGRVTNSDDITVVNDPNILVELKIGGGQSDMMSSPVPYTSLFGNGGQAENKHHTLALPRVFDPGTTIAGKLQNLDAVIRHVRLSFIGFRVYD